MPDHRLYHFERGHIVKARTLKAADDAEAIEQSRLLAGNLLAELWRGAAKIKTFNELPS